jgi:hypothetical protein
MDVRADPAARGLTLVTAMDRAHERGLNDGPTRAAVIVDMKQEAEAIVGQR